MESEEIKAKCSSLALRRDELQRMLKLQREVEDLERQLLIGKSDDVRMARLIAETVAQSFGIPLACITGRSREECFVVPRHITFYLVRKHVQCSQHAIGKMFRRDHGTVCHAEQLIKDRCETNQKFLENLVVIDSECRKRLATLHREPIT